MKNMNTEKVLQTKNVTDSLLLHTEASDHFLISDFLYAE